MRRWDDPDARHHTYLPKFATVFGFDPRTVDTFTIREFDGLAAEADRVEKQARKPR